MRGIGIIFKRELRAYFATPVAYVFIVIFLVSNGYIFTFYVGGFYEARAGGSRTVFFQFHPWLIHVF